MTYKIEKNVPLPSARTTYPFREMAVGDSFSFYILSHRNVRSAASRYTKRYPNASFTIRGNRCWRIK